MDKIIKPRFLARMAKLRLAGSLFFYATAVSMLIISFIIFIWMWAYAYYTDYIPDLAWGEKMGNHGPWRRRGILRDTWWWVFETQLITFMLAVLSLVIKPNRKAAYVAGIVIITFLLFFFTHYWLVD